MWNHRAREEIYLTNARCRMLLKHLLQPHPGLLKKWLPLQKTAVIIQAKSGFGRLARKPAKRVDLSDLKSRIRAFNRASQGDAGSVDVGDRVIHKKFGTGTVVKVPESGDHRLDIEFDDYGLKRFMKASPGLKDRLRKEIL